MSLDRSLKGSGSLAKHRNVLSRAERITQLSDKGSFDMSMSDPLGLPKVANRKVVTGAKAAKKAEAAAAAAAEAEAGGAPSPAGGATPDAT